MLKSLYKRDTQRRKENNFINMVIFLNFTWYKPFIGTPSKEIEILKNRNRKITSHSKRAATTFLRLGQFLIYWKTKQRHIFDTKTNLTCSIHPLSHMLMLITLTNLLEHWRQSIKNSNGRFNPMDSLNIASKFNMLDTPKNSIWMTCSNGLKPI